MFVFIQVSNHTQKHCVSIGAHIQWLQESIRNTSQNVTAVDLHTCYLSIMFQTSLILICVKQCVYSGISCILIQFCFPCLSQERRNDHCLSSRCSFIWRHSYVLFARNPRSVSNEAVCGYGCRYTSVAQRCVSTSSVDLNECSLCGSDRATYFSAVWFTFCHSFILIPLCL